MLRRIVREAVIDHVREPRGPNSHDDASDRQLDDPMLDRINDDDDGDSGMTIPGPRR